MDILTHTLAALTLSQAGLNRKTRFATLALVIGANLPDVDLLRRFGGPEAYLKYQRGITHSILGVTILAGLLAGALYYIARKFPARKNAGATLRPRWLCGICWIATASNLVLNLTTSYGVRPLLPFSSRSYAGDLLSDMDPLWLGFLALGLGIPALLRLISEEVGDPKPATRRGAALALVGVALLLGLRDLAHRRVLAMLDSRTYSEENPQQVGAFPILANPFSWVGVVETASAFHVLSVSALDPEVNPDHVRIFHKPEPSRVLETVMATRTAGIFRGFARYPWVQVEESEEGYEATLYDLRYASPDAQRPSYVGKINLDKSLAVRSETLSSDGTSGVR